MSVSWKEAVVRALERLGGEARLSEIYAKIGELGERELVPSWKKLVRATLEDGGSFYSVYGTKARRGRWGLADVKSAKERFLREHGHFYCEACGFRFDETYGEEYIEAHHAAGGEYLMLCANCHAMLHRHKPWLTRETIAELFWVQMRL